jgi:protease PrsW
MAGWIAPSEVALLSTLAGRSRWRRAVRQRSGKEAAKAVAEYQTAVTELAFLRSRMSRGAVGPNAWDLHNERLNMLTVARARAIGQPAALTAAWLRPPPSGWAPAAPHPPGWRPEPSPPLGWGPPPR